MFVFFYLPTYLPTYLINQAQVVYLNIVFALTDDGFPHLDALHCVSLQAKKVESFLFHLCIFAVAVPKEEFGPKSRFRQKWPSAFSARIHRRRHLKTFAFYDCHMRINSGENWPNLEKPHACQCDQMV